MLTSHSMEHNSTELKNRLQEKIAATPLHLHKLHKMGYSDDKIVEIIETARSALKHNLHVFEETGSPESPKFTAAQLKQSEEQEETEPDNDQVPRLTELYNNTGVSATQRQHAFDKNLTKLDTNVLDDMKGFYEEMERKLKRRSKVQVRSSSNPPAPAKRRSYFHLMHKLSFGLYKRI